MTALLITGISEIGRRYRTVAAILASLPLTSILAMTWLYWDTKDNQKVIDLSYGIFWAVLPSLVFFIALPVLLKTGMKFAWAMLLACAITGVFYFIYLFIVKKFGIKL